MRRARLADQEARDQLHEPPPFFTLCFVVLLRLTLALTVFRAAFYCMCAQRITAPLLQRHSLLEITEATPTHGEIKWQSAQADPCQCLGFGCCARNHRISSPLLLLHRIWGVQKIIDTSLMVPQLSHLSAAGFYTLHYV